MVKSSRNSAEVNRIRLITISRITSCFIQGAHCSFIILPASGSVRERANRRFHYSSRNACAKTDSPTIRRRIVFEFGKDLRLALCVFSPAQLPIDQHQIVAGSEILWIDRQDLTKAFRRTLVISLDFTELAQAMHETPSSSNGRLTREFFVSAPLNSAAGL